MKPSALKILRDLQHAGPVGRTTADLLHVGGSRYSARIHELRRDGHNITEHRERQGSSRYVLQPDASPVVEGEPDAPARLFAGVEVGHGQRSAIFGAEEAA
jgi:hypothetical protein